MKTLKVGNPVLHDPVGEKWDRKKKSRIRETSNLSTDADRRTDTILKRLRDFSKKLFKKNGGGGQIGVLAPSVCKSLVLGT